MIFTFLIFVGSMLLIKNTTIVTQNSERQIIENGAILVEKDKIADIGQSTKLEKKYAKLKKKIIDGRGKVAIPGFNKRAYARSDGFIARLYDEVRTYFIENI